MFQVFPFAIAKKCIGFECSDPLTAVTLNQDEFSAECCNVSRALPTFCGISHQYLPVSPWQWTCSYILSYQKSIATSKDFSFDDAFRSYDFDVSRFR
jgi:hypothetical protein